MSGGTHTETRAPYYACLQDDESEATLDCGCKLERCDCCTAVYLTLCALHEHADDLRLWARRCAYTVGYALMTAAAVILLWLYGF